MWLILSHHEKGVKGKKSKKKHHHTPTRHLACRHTGDRSRRALASGARGREFESPRSDQPFQLLNCAGAFPGGGLGGALA